MKKDASQPFRVELYVVPGHATVTDRRSASTDAIVNTVLERTYMGPGVKMYNLRDYDKQTRIRGALFLPPGTQS